MCGVHYKLKTYGNFSIVTWSYWLISYSEADEFQKNVQFCLTSRRWAAWLSRHYLQLLSPDL